MSEFPICYFFLIHEYPHQTNMELLWSQAEIIHEIALKTDYDTVHKLISLNQMYKRWLDNHPNEYHKLAMKALPSQMEEMIGCHGVYYDWLISNEDALMEVHDRVMSRFTTLYIRYQTRATEYNYDTEDIHTLKISHSEDAHISTIPSSVDYSLCEIAKERNASEYKLFTRRRNKDYYYAQVWFKYGQNINDEGPDDIIVNVNSITLRWKGGRCCVVICNSRFRPGINGDKRDEFCNAGLDYIRKTSAEWDQHVPPYTLSPH